jgi:2-iminobutanoate/2-iminopropanoate deaminase
MILSMSKPTSILTSTIVILTMALVTMLAAAYAKESKRKVVAPAGSTPSPNYSAGIQFENTLYISGQSGSDPKTQKIPANFDDEVKQCLENLGSVLHAGGMDFSDAVSVQVFLTDMDLFPRMNAVYTQVFKEPRPTRTTLGVTRLPGNGAHVEMTVIARK